MDILSEPEFIIHCVVPSSEVGLSESERALVVIRGRTARDFHRHMYGSGPYQGVICRAGITRYTGLEIGQVVPLELRGMHSPVIPFKWLTTNFRTMKMPKL